MSTDVDVLMEDLASWMGTHPVEDSTKTVNDQDNPPFELFKFLKTKL